MFVTESAIEQRISVLTDSYGHCIIIPKLISDDCSNVIDLYEIIVMLILVIGIIAITAVLLAYFKKHKSNRIK